MSSWKTGGWTSLVWLPLELLFLAKARSNPRWLFALPVLCVLWVNTHGSILLGLLVLAVELGWSLVPARLVQRIGGTNQAPHAGALALTLLGSLLASFLTPYGPGLLLYDVGVSRNSQIAQYIWEWNSPDFHSTTVLLVYCVPLVVLIACIRLRRVRSSRDRSASSSSRKVLRTQRLVVYLMLVAVGLAACLPMRPPWGATARRWAGAGMVAWALAILVVPAVPAGTVAPSQPVQAFNYLSGRSGRVFTEYTWGDYSIFRHRATFADGRTDLFEGKVLTGVLRHHRDDDQPRPDSLVVPRVLCRVGPGHAPLGVPDTGPASACRGPQHRGSGLRPALNSITRRQTRFPGRPRPRRNEPSREW